MDLQEQLDRLRNAIRQGTFRSEAAVSQGVVLPILNALGWPVFNTAVVTPEFSLEGRRVDFALCHPENQPAVFVEVKQIGMLEGADRQLFEYAFHRGVPMAILTDGQEWSFYLPGEQGRYTERRVYKLDLLERDVTEASERLRRYLSYDRTASGQALEAARSDYKDVARTREIDATIPRAWQNLLQEQDSLLLDLLAEKVEDLCGYKADLDVCGRFIESIQTSAIAPSTKGKVRPAPPGSPGTPDRPAARRRMRSVEAFTFSFRGKDYHAGSARDVMLQVFRLLAESDPLFLERFVARKHGRKRRYVAREKTELYPGRPDLAQVAAAEITPGWWMGTNYSRRDIQKIIFLAREVVDPEIGKTLQVQVEE